MTLYPICLTGSQCDPYDEVLPGRGHVQGWINGESLTLSWAYRSSTYSLFCDTVDFENIKNCKELFQV